MDLSFLESPLFTCAQFVLAMGLFSWGQARRDHYAARVCAVVALCVSMTVAEVCLSNADKGSELSLQPLWLQFGLFAAIALAWMPLIRFCHDVSWQRSAFLAVAGYTTQNLADSTGGLWAVIQSQIGGGGPAFAPSGQAISPMAMSLDSFVASVVCTIVVYALCYVLFARNLSQDWHLKPRDWHVAGLFAIMLAFSIVFDLTLKQAMSLDMTFVQRLVFSTTKIVFGGVLLYVEFGVFLGNRMIGEMEAMQQVLDERERQYNLSRTNIDAINNKMHDLRHGVLEQLMGSNAQVDASTLKDIARHLNVYNSQVRTGNVALDTVISEKSLLCEQEGITFTCIADGSALDFMAPAQIYSLMGSLLDDAIASSLRIAEARKRSISLVIDERAGMATIHAEHRFNKAEGHPDGAGRTIAAMAERQGGSYATSTDDGTFYASVLLPIPEG